MTIEQIIAAELKVKPQQVHAALELLDGGNTIPFIARYRKEATGTLDEEALRSIEERAKYLRQLEERRAEILAAIEAQEDAAVKMQELEDLYLPYRPKKRTRAQIAREKGLEPLAELITQQVQPSLPLEKLAALHIDAEKGVNSTEEAWQGAMDIVAENITAPKKRGREQWTLLPKTSRITPPYAILYAANCGITPSLHRCLSQTKQKPKTF